MHEFANLDGECVLDFVGRSKAVGAGLAELSQRLQVPITKAADVATTVQRWNSYNTLYREDFERFGYKRVDPGDVPPRSMSPGR